MTTYSFYWAAPLFTHAEQDFNLKCVTQIEALGYKNKVFLPQRDNPHAGIGGHLCFEANKNALQRSENLIAVVDGPDVDSGTSWEVGYFSALINFEIKPMGDIYLLRTDFRESSDGAFGVNLMISESITIPAIFKSFMELFNHLISFKVEIHKGE